MATSRPTHEDPQDPTNSKGDPWGDLDYVARGGHLPVTDRESGLAHVAELRKLLASTIEIDPESTADLPQPDQPK